MKTKKKRPFTIQHDERDCGAACLSMIAEYYGAGLKLETCRNLIKVGSEGASIYGLIMGASKIGLWAEAYGCGFRELIEEVKAGKVQFPVVIRVLSEGIYEHFIVLYSLNSRFAIVGNPAKRGVCKMPLNELENVWLGQLITFEKGEGFIERDERENNIRKYFGEIWKQKISMILVFLGAVIILLINLAGAYLFRFILSDSYNVFYIGGYVVSNGIEKLCIALILLYLFRILVEMIRCNILTRITKRIDMSITLGYYRHFIKLKIEAFDVRKTGDFISRFYDTGEIRYAVSSVVLSAILDAGMVVISGVVLIRLNRVMFLAAATTVSLYIVIVINFKDKIKKTKNDVMAAEAIVTSSLKESVDGIQTIKAFNLEDRNIEKMHSMYDRLTDKMMMGARVINMQNVLASFVASAGIVIVIGIGYKQYLRGILTMADIFTFYYMLDYFMGPISGIITFQPDVETAIIAADRLADVMDIEEEKTKSVKILPDGDIELKNVTFRYGYDDSILENFNLKIRKGTKMAIVGESGSGKTTLAKLIMGFYTPEKGIISIDGKNMNEYPVNVIRKGIAYISQDVFLFEDSLYNNLTLGNPDIDKESIEKIVEECGLTEFVSRLPYGYKTLITEGGRNLSGGERQRIAIARAMISKKKIIIMDEVTSNLDMALEEKINHMIKDLSCDTTFIIITHRGAVMEFCDEIFEL